MEKVEGPLVAGREAATGAAPPTTPKLVLVGFMGSGKSSAVRLAAERLGVEALDSDALLEVDLGESIESFFERQGESAFREREEALVAELLDRRPGPVVVALGGGSVESERVREKLADHVCVHLEVEPDAAWERSKRSGRPLARERDRFMELHARRLPLYESVARAVVLPVDELTLPQALASALPLTDPEISPAVALTWAPTREGGYPVYIGEGALDAAGALWPCKTAAFVVADEAVNALHGDRLEAALSSARTLTVPPGEQHKTLSELERLTRALAQAGMERADSLAAFGGGVIGDLAGLCAAVYQRGVALVQIPTTLVAQVDSAYGGKTGVDLPEAKNYVGVFHQPEAVFADPTLLTTLPPGELSAGFAELVKTGLIGGGALWEQVRELPPLADALAGEIETVRRAIGACVRTKLAVVAEDERDLGARASLNLGHTFAHALEAATGYAAHRHGEAVGLGLLVALRLSERELGLDPSVRDELRELIRRQGLPTEFSGPSTEELLEHAGRDKKRRGGRANLVLLRAPGDVATECEPPEQALREAIEEVRAT